MGNDNIKKVKELAVGVELGNIYYKWNDEIEDYDTLRIVKIQNKEIVSCICTSGDSICTKKMSIVKIREEYEQLLSNAVLTISKVVSAYTPNGTPIPDVVIMVFKREDANTEFGEPDIVCRQGITDIFYEPYCNQEENPMVGISVSKDTIPAGYTMSMITTMDVVQESMIMNIYRTDTIDSILSIIGTKRWDEVLIDLLQNKYNTDRETNVFLAKECPDTYYGYCKNIRLLLQTNNFLYDLYSMLGMVKVKFEIPFDYDVANNQLPEDQKEQLQDLYEINMAKTTVIPYDFSIDFDKVRMPYLLVMDSTDTLYMVVYTRSEHEYVKHFDTTVLDQMAEINKRLSETVEYYEKHSMHNRNYSK